MEKEKRLIDANALLDYLRKEKAELEQYGYVDQAVAEGIGEIIAEVEKANTVAAVEVVHGRWEEWWPGINLILTGEEMLYRCTVCDAKYPDVEGYRYCPYCGAKMDGESNVPMENAEIDFDYEAED